MYIAVDELLSFYRSPLGRISRRTLRDALLALTGDEDGARVVGLGFATPYLECLAPRSERKLALMPAGQGFHIWPRGKKNCSALVDPLELPLTDSAVDLVVATHLFEFVREPEELMRELWRVSTPGAHLLIVVPRRTGLWAQRDNTPFGYGHPYSRNQLSRLLESNSFKPVAWRETLYFPPTNMGVILKSARLFERIGRLTGPAFAGAMVVLAKKQMFPAVVRRRPVSVAVRLPGLLPETVLPAHRSQKTACLDLT